MLNIFFLVIIPRCLLHALGPVVGKNTGYDLLKLMMFGAFALDGRTLRLIFELPFPTKPLD